MVSRSSTATGPTMLVAMKSLGGVAQATPRAMPPKAQATNAPAVISFQSLWCRALLTTVPSVLNVDIVLSFGLRDDGKTSRPARRPSAGAVPLCSHHAPRDEPGSSCGFFGLVTRSVTATLAGGG